MPSAVKPKNCKPKKTWSFISELIKYNCMHNDLDFPENVTLIRRKLASSLVVNPTAVDTPAIQTLTCTFHKRPKNMPLI